MKEKTRVGLGGLNSTLASQPAESDWNESFEPERSIDSIAQQRLRTARDGRTTRADYPGGLPDRFRKKGSPPGVALEETGTQMVSQVMAIVRFLDPPSHVDVPVGSTVLQAARASGAPIGSTCGGACACSGCHIIVEAGADALSEMDDDEETILSTAFGIGEQSRLACQATIEQRGTVTVRVTPETRQAFEELHARAG
jgi:ferredoxin, 2Fe-2S